MARYQTTIDVPASRRDTFRYLSDFENAREWDPGVVEARKLTEGPVDVGTTYKIVSRFLMRDVPLDYRVTAFEPATRVVFEADNSTLHSHDEISFDDGTGGGTRFTYTADLQLAGLARVFDPILSLAFRRIGRRARDGLQHALSPDPLGR